MNTSAQPRGRRGQNAALRSRNLVVRQGRTSIRLERTLWEAFDDVRAQLGMSSREFSLFVDEHRPVGVSFTSAIRIFLVNYFRGYPQRMAEDVEIAMSAGVAALSGSDGLSRTEKSIGAGMRPDAGRYPSYDRGPP